MLLRKAMQRRRTSTDSAQIEPSGPVLTEKAWDRVRHNGERVRDEVTGGLPPELRPAVWRHFREMPMARCACQLLSLLEPQHNTRNAGLYGRRSRRPTCAGLFDDIPSLSDRDTAEKIYAELCERHAHRLDSCRWLRPVLAGRARRLAKHSEALGSAWGRQMRRKKAGKHTQQRYREQGWHPLASVRKARELHSELHPRLQTESKL
jgi:hypothetical protein